MSGSRTPAEVKKHYKEYGSTTEQKKNRAKRNKARREAIRDGRAKKGDGKDVHHKKALINGGSNSKSNTSVVSASKNRGYKRNAKNKPK